jgi:hypothetical protein
MFAFDERRCAPIGNTFENVAEDVPCDGSIRARSHSWSGYVPFAWKGLQEEVPKSQWAISAHKAYQSPAILPRSDPPVSSTGERTSSPAALEATAAEGKDSGSRTFHAEASWPDTDSEGEADNLYDYRHRLKGYGVSHYICDDEDREDSPNTDLLHHCLRPEFAASAPAMPLRPPWLQPQPQPGSREVVGLPDHVSSPSFKQPRRGSIVTATPRVETGYPMLLGRAGANSGKLGMCSDRHKTIASPGYAAQSAAVVHSSCTATPQPKPVMNLASCIDGAGASDCSYLAGANFAGSGGDRLLGLAPLDDTAQDEAGDVTTLMVRNVPRCVGRRMFLQELDETGFAGMYDFFYMPVSFKTGENQGFAFINLKSPPLASAFSRAWRQRRFGVGPEGVCLNISTAAVQGLEGNIAKWNSPRLRRIRNPEFLPFVVTDSSKPEQQRGRVGA